MSIKAIRRNLQQEYGNMPSTATIYEWIQKYTQYATDSIKDYQPKHIGDMWVADETVLEIDGNNGNHQGHCSQCGRVWTLNERQGACSWCNKPASCITATDEFLQYEKPDYCYPLARYRSQNR
ncbi:hypothetical protein ACFLYR_01785 [Chloroflexota bacterium]